MAYLGEAQGRRQKKKLLLLTVVLLSLGQVWGGELPAYSVTAKMVSDFFNHTNTLSSNQKMIISQDLSTITFPSFHDPMTMNYKPWGEGNLIFHKNPSVKNGYYSKMYGETAVASFNSVNTFIIQCYWQGGKMGTITVTPNYGPQQIGTVQAIKNKIKVLINSQ